MDADNTARILYLSLLGAAVAFWFFTQNRQSLGKTMQMVAAWVFIFMGVIAVVGLWEDIRGTVSPGTRMTVTDSRVEVPRAPDGHYYLQLLVNGEPVDFMVDTGASQMVLTQRDAERAGIDPDNLNYFGRAMTANGEVRTAPAQLDSVTLGQFTDSDITAWVNEGDMDQSLLGMEYLQRWSSIQITGGALVLAR
ncbi:aspartyl protease family protein [Cribrihabitans marinus]|uniref:Aspartyl protease family protein n=1 Tax=Cribrihabitans marinus TaxID=1227549 RepID=A0A1H6QMI5_9RHOB|nr:TIGR02281 family clan AA aspartic protease [Cribrihabitans marinus]GGH19379.1 aspartyl protease [Cribrihabitans marinus]SEI44948.1 aspartyl protease family protein [Cribrihabitans marinus]